MSDRPAKIGFKIKLSSETSEKLKQEESQNAQKKDLGLISKVPALPNSTSGILRLENSENNDSKCPDETLPDEAAGDGSLSKISRDGSAVENEVSLKDIIETTQSIKDVVNEEIDKSNSQDASKVTGNRESISEDKDNSVSDDIIEEKDGNVTNDKNNGADANTASTDIYAQHIHYEGEVAVYTDPVTKHKFIWSTSQNEWILKSNDTEDIPNESENKDESLKANENSGKRGFENDTHTYTDEDGSVYIWDEPKKAWFPKVDDEFLAHYQMAYGFVDNTTPEKETETEEAVKKESEAKDLKRKVPPEPPKWFDVSEEQNTNVYVSNLPLDITEEEFVDFMQKCGLVMRDPTTQKMKVKLYTRPNSKQLKGDALCTYIKIESVELALSILDGYMLRNHRIKVQKAQFQMKGEYDPTLKPKKKRRKDKEKIKKMQEKLFDWRPEKFRGERSKHEKVVIIKNVFDPSIFDAEVQLILEYQQDLREECAKCGEVKKVVLYDRHPEGVAQVSMKEPEEADSVVKLINGRWFGKRQLTAEIWDGKTKYKMEETDADLNKRLGNWVEFLEDPETKKRREALEAEQTKPPEDETPEACTSPLPV